MFRVESQGAVDVVKPLAPLNQESAKELVETIRCELTDGQPMLVLDMSDIPMIDSAGLEALLDCQVMLQQRGGVMKLSAIPQLCSEVLRITSVGHSFEKYPDTKTAVGSFSQ